MFPVQHPPSDDWTEVWLASYRVTGNVGQAAEAAGVTRQAVYYRRKIDPEFAAAWTEATPEAAAHVADRLEEVALARALNGSEILLIFMLKGALPEKYRDNPKVYVHAGKLSDAELIAAGQGVLARIGGALAGAAAALPAGLGGEGEPAD